MSVSVEEVVAPVSDEVVSGDDAHLRHMGYLVRLRRLRASLPFRRAPPSRYLRTLSTTPSQPSVLVRGGARKLNGRGFLALRDAPVAWPCAAQSSVVCRPSRPARGSLARLLRWKQPHAAARSCEDRRSGRAAARHCRLFDPAPTAPRLPRHSPRPPAPLQGNTSSAPPSSAPLCARQRRCKSTPRPFRGSDALFSSPLSPS